MATKIRKDAFTKAMHTNWGRNDAAYDISRGNRNREYILPGHDLSLPADNPEYSQGYKDEWYAHRG
jgi:hypothetical protein